MKWIVFGGEAYRHDRLVGIRSVEETQMDDEFADETHSYYVEFIFENGNAATVQTKRLLTSQEIAEIIKLIDHEEDHIIDGKKIVEKVEQSSPP